MTELLQNTAFQISALAVFALVFLLSVVAITIAKFYRRCGADEALVRTGAGGNKVVIGGGITVYPILHQLLRVSLRSNKLSVERSDKNALVTKDKIKANVTTELYVKVEPLAEDVLAAARSFGDRSLDAHAIGTLIEGKLTDALRSVAANQTFMDLHSQRKQFAEHIQNALAEELKKNGLTLENVSITSFSMVPVTELDSQDVFDAEGLRAITESVQSNAEKTNRVQREKEIAIRLQNVEAKKQALALEQDQAQAEADQTRRVAEYSALQRAETAKVVYAQEQVAELAAYDKHQATETARIVQEREIAVAQATRMRHEREAQIATEKAQQAAEIAKQREIEAQMIEKEKTVQAAEIDRQKALEAATIEKQKVVEASIVAKEQTVETARIAKQIAVTQSEELAARAAALRAQAQAEEEGAKQGIITVEETARAERAKAIAIIKAQEDAEKSNIAAEREAYRTKLEADARAQAARTTADGEANAVITLAEATLKRGEAEAEAKRRLVEANNSVATKLLFRDVIVKALEVMPEVTKELMAPAHAIKEIKVLQLQGTQGGAANGNGASGNQSPFGVASPILKTILEAGAAYPLLREMLNFSQVDGGDLASKARALLGKLPAELKSVVDSDPELSAKVAELTRTDEIQVTEAAPQAAE
jgi:flotillin